MRISEIGLLDTQCWKVLCQKIAEENLFDFSFDSTLSILDTQVKIKLGHICKTFSVKRNIEKEDFPPLCYCETIEFNLLIQHYFTVLFSLAEKIETTTIAVEN